MRISQIKTLCWAGNALVLAGAGYVGLHFWETLQARDQFAEVSWPEETDGPALRTRWPGEITAFRDIWKTPVNGVVPKPPETVSGPAPKADRKRDFLASHQCTTVMFVLGNPGASVAYIKVPGAESDMTMRTGEDVAGFTLIGFETSPDTGAPVLVFTHPEVEGLVRMERSAQPRPPLFDPPPFQVVTQNDLVQPRVVREGIPRRAYQDLLSDPSGLTWVVPEEETAWWGEFGEEDVFSKLVVNAVTNADGTPRGIRLMSQPGQGTPVGTGRGLNQGDIIISVNGVPVRGKEDIVAYLRGDGRRLTRYAVVVESETGLERTVVYNVERRRRRTASR